MDGRYDIKAYMEDFPALNNKPNTSVTTFTPYFSDAPCVINHVNSGPGVRLYPVKGGTENLVGDVT